MNLWYLSEKTGRNYERTMENRTKEDDFELPLFSLATISTATDNFSLENKLGEGGFGPVYRVSFSYMLVQKNKK